MNVKFPICVILSFILAILVVFLILAIIADLFLRAKVFNDFASDIWYSVNGDVLVISNNGRYVTSTVVFGLRNSDDTYETKTLEGRFIINAWPFVYNPTATFKSDDEKIKFEFNLANANVKVYSDGQLIEEFYKKTLPTN